MSLLRKILGPTTVLACLHAAAALMPMQSVAAQNPPPGFIYETLDDGGLQSATAMAFLPDGRLLITERQTGNIRVFKDGQLDPNPWATIAVHHGGQYAEAGLVGIAVDPGFLINGYVYVYYTAPGGTENRVSRLEEVNGVGTNLTVLTPANGITAQLYHNAGPMVFGHDGKLFVATGDALGAAHAQNPGNWRGKILRFEVPNLTIPSDNPTPGSAVYSIGHRNQFGLAIHPVTGDLFQTENGGTWMDEINRIVPGGNYGWPIVEGQELTPDPALVDPLAFFHPTTAPTGCCFYSGEHWPVLYRNVWFYTNFNGNELQAVWLNATGTAVVNQQTFDDLPGRGFGVTMGPDGNLWYLTSDNGGFGADELGRYVYVGQVAPSLQASSVSNKTLGASMTMCLHAQNGSVAVPWLSLSRFATPIATPLGQQWVPGDAVLDTVYINHDERGYLPLDVPNIPAFLGSSVHCQAIVIDPQSTFTMTNPSELVIRG